MRFVDRVARYLILERVLNHPKRSVVIAGVLASSLGVFHILVQFSVHSLSSRNYFHLVRRRGRSRWRLLLRLRLSASFARLLHLPALLHLGLYLRQRPRPSFTHFLDAGQNARKLF